MGAAIIAGVDAEAVEHGVVRDWCLPVSLGRDAGGDPSVGQSGTKPVCVVAPVCESRLRIWTAWAIPDHEDDAAHGPPVVDPRHAVRQRKNRARSGASAPPIANTNHSRQRLLAPPMNQPFDITARDLIGPDHSLWKHEPHSSMEIARAALSGGRIAFEGNLPWHNVSSAKNSCNSDVVTFR
jgi:hypothetical protein